MSQPATVPDNLTAEREQFCRLYVHGDPDCEETVQGVAYQAYWRAFDCTKATAQSAAYRLLRDERVRTRIAELREEARSVLEEVLPDWRDEVASAMRTLRWARTGQWPERFDGDDQAKRSAVQAAEHTLDRALGSVKQMHELSIEKRSIVVQVAGEAHAPQLEERDGREVSSALPSDTSGGERSSGGDPYERLLGEEVEYTSDPSANE